MVGIVSMAGAGSRAYGYSNGGADSYGITTYAMQGLITSLTQSSVYFDDNTSGAATATWTSDGTGNFARLTWPAAGGTAGLSWDVIDTTNRSIYVRWDYRRSVATHTKRMKLFGRGYSANYSNFNVHYDYGSNNLGISYTDKTTGGDIDVQFVIGSYPTLTGGSAFSQTPHPVLQSQTTTADPYDSTWHTHEFYGLHSTDGNHDGEMAYWLDGTLIFWANSAFTCRTGGQGFAFAALGNYSNGSASTLTEDFRLWSMSHDRPVGRGI